jgi:hypothetical protein
VGCKIIYLHSTFKALQTLTTQNTLAEFSHESRFFVLQINPYVQAFYNTGDDVTIHTIEGEIRENVGQLQVYCTCILTFSPEIWESSK